MRIREKGYIMTTKNFVDQYGRDVSVDIFYAGDGTDSVYASITRDGGRLGEFILAQGRVYACRNWDELNQRYRELILVNPYDPIIGVLIGSQDVIIYIERFAEILGKIRGQTTYGRR